MSSQEPISAAQLQVARSAAWRQSGEPILTLEAARDWLAPLGLVLFTPRAQQLGAPAPSFVEATLGEANEAPSLAQSESARGLVARLVAEGHAVPLNLLGGPGDLPDFIASAQVFSFLYTLRGDKLWKQPPATSGTNKVTPLALAVYELLTERGELSAAEIASELGRELTESAIARALSELWQRLRVLPLLPQGEGATKWELTTRRFTKSIKAGTNAGQPTALSALVSLYLAQALLASEEEVAAFLSPIAARSRIREVLHALVGARELGELVIDGKTLVHIPGALPEFPEIELPAVQVLSGDEETSGQETPAIAESGEGGGSSEGNEKIKRFAPRREPDAASFRGKRVAGGGPRAARPAAGGFRKSSGPPGSGRPASRSPRREGGPPNDRERRPFQRAESAAARPERSQYAKPWAEDRKPRPAASGPATSEGAEGRPTRTPNAGGDRPYRAKPFGDRKPSTGKPFGDRKPFAGRSGSGDPDRPRRSFSASADGSSGRPERGSRREGAEGAKPFRPRTGSGGDAGSRPFRPRPAGAGEERPRRAASDRPAGDRPFSARPSRTSGFSRSPGAGSSAGRPPRDTRESGFRPMRREGAASGGDQDRPPFRRREEGAVNRPASGAGRPPFQARSGPPSDRKPFADRKPFGERKPFNRAARSGGEEGVERPRRTFSNRDSSERPRPSGDRAPGGDRKGPPRAGKPFPRPSSGGSGSSRGFEGRAGRPGGPSRGGAFAKPAGKRPFGKASAKSAGPRRAGPPSGDRPVRRPRADE